MLVLAFDISFEPIIIASLLLYTVVILKAIVHLSIFLLTQKIRLLTKIVTDSPTYFTVSSIRTCNV